MKEEYELIPLKKEHIKNLYDWYLNEENFEHFTCRPVKPKETYEKYCENLNNNIKNKNILIYTLIKSDSKPLGKITLFDYNIRNKSAEFGYYFPEESRGKGFGSILLKKFIKVVFSNEEYDLNKIYATTASNNIPSIKLLEKNGFSLDGTMREHYFIKGKKYNQLIYSLLKSEIK